MSMRSLQYSRRKWGRGFQYIDAQNQKLACQKQLKHIKSLAVPPMWTNVVISTDPEAKIQATGRDLKNRKQYIYNETWQKQQQQKKFKQLITFAKKLPIIRDKCNELIDETGPQREKVLALLVLILDETGIRIGNERYTQLNKTHGLTTLKTKHLIDSDGDLSFEFVGKGSKQREVKIDDCKLSEHIKACSQYPGYNLFRYKDESNKWQNVSSEDLNEFIADVAGNKFSAKDFRTWFATCAAVEAYQEIGEDITQSRKAPINQVVQKVCARLGNTPAICKAYYIHPKILEKITALSLPFKEMNNKKQSANKNGYSTYELEVLRVLTSRRKHLV